MTPGGEEGSGPAGTPVGGRYVVTTDQQRREWGLPDLANGPGGDAAAPGDPDAMERAGAVSVVDSADALDLLFEDGASRSVAAALVDGVGGDVAAAAAGGRRCGRTRPGAFVNLKHGRGRGPDHVLAVFGELCRPGRIDSLLKSLDGLIKPLERMLAPGLEAAVREVEAVRGQEVTAERLAETGGADSADERTERVAKACSTIEKRLDYLVARQTAAETHGAAGDGVAATLLAEYFGRELPGGIRVRYARTMDDVLEVVLPDVLT